jgi:prolyl oligopeptidase
MHLLKRCKAATSALLLIAFFTVQTLPLRAQSKTIAKSPSAHGTSEKLTYPIARKSDQVDDYFGTKVADPYRWLEDPDSVETREWVEAENKVTFSYLSGIPEREQIKERLTKLYNYERYGLPFQKGGRYFYFRNDGLQNQAVLYTMSSFNGQPKVLIDPNTLSADGTVALSDVELSDDGKLMAYGISASGSDWQEWRVKDVETARDLPDIVKWVKFSGTSWTNDNKGFFYGRYDEPNENTKLQDANFYHKLYYHRIGTQQAEDTLIYERKDQKEWGFGSTVTEDGRYLIITAWRGSGNKVRIFFKDLNDKSSEVVKLIDNFDNAYDFLGNDGSVFYFQTDIDAPRGRVVSIDTTKAIGEGLREIIPQSPDALQSVSFVNNMLVATYLKDAQSEVRIYRPDGKFVRDVALPGIGSAGGFGGRRRDVETFYAYTAFTTPTTVYRYNMVTGASTIFRQPKVDFDPRDFETKQVFYKSKDGTRVPMFITYKKGLKLDGQNPTYLYAYGGFSVSLTPYFSVINLVWMNMGGVLAIPNLRGGSEYGEEWHQAGMKAKKQNVFDDFIAAADWLIANKYTSTPKLAIGGGSNGGLLIGAVLNQRPDLIGAALPAVGVMDMLRFHNFTIGHAWVGEYGSSDNAEEFKTLYAYSPLHNIKPGTNYPATMITTADHDDRVVPAHSFKYAATLQAAQAGPAPILIRIETKAGHGGGKPITKIIEEAADAWGFLVRIFKMKLASAKS